MRENDQKPWFKISLKPFHAKSQNALMTQGVLISYLFEYKLHFFVLKIHPKSQMRLVHEVRNALVHCYCARVIEMALCTFTCMHSCACTLQLFTGYLDGALHIHVCTCACTHMYTATMRVLSRWCFAPSCVCMHTATVCMLSRWRFAPPGINYLRTMNAVNLMAFKLFNVNLMNKCCLKNFVLFDQVKCRGATSVFIQV